MKQCSKCGEIKPLSEFAKNNRNVDRLSSHCKICACDTARKWNAANRDRVCGLQRRWKANNPEKVRQQNKWSREKSLKKYNMSVSEYEEMLKEQGGFCAICGGSNNGKVLVVDHCHETEEIRGLLCSNCNTALGLIHDDHVVAERMADYLSGNYRLMKMFGVPVELPAARLSKMEFA
jgi:hypothetical protein